MVGGSLWGSRREDASVKESERMANRNSDKAKKKKKKKEM